MPKAHRYEVLDDHFAPRWSPPGVDRERQAIRMRALQGLSNDIAEGFRRRDELMAALDSTHSLSRRDMAAATGLSRGRVDQIIREVTELNPRLELNRRSS